MTTSPRSPNDGHRSVTITHVGITNNVPTFGANMTRNFAIVTVAALAAEITFVEVDNKHVPVIDGHALVFSGGQSPSKGFLATFTTNDERAQNKAAARLRAGRMAPLAKLTKTGRVPKAWSVGAAVVKVEVVEAYHTAAIANRDANRDAAKTRKGKTDPAETVAVTVAPKAELPPAAIAALEAAVAGLTGQIEEATAANDFALVVDLTGKLCEAQAMLAA